MAETYDLSTFLTCPQAGHTFETSRRRRPRRIYRAWRGGLWN